MHYKKRSYIKAGERELQQITTIHQMCVLNEQLLHGDDEAFLKEG